MAKKAIVVIGSHHAGKSRTIREHLKPMLGIGIDDRKFNLDGVEGRVLSQSLEEAKRDIEDFVEKYSQYDLLVFSTRPEGENPSYLVKVGRKLRERGFRVSEVQVSKGDNYENKASEIYGHLAR